jgi:hypothetical protein
MNQQRFAMKKLIGGAGLEAGEREEEAMRTISMGRTALITGVVVLVLGAALLGGGQSTAQAGPPDDAVLDWNLYAVQALINGPTATPAGAGQPPPVSVLHLGMVQGAVYDAVNMIDGRHEPYLDGLPPAPASASKVAAVATAAHDVLVGVNVVPPLSQAIVDRLDDLHEASIAAATVQDGSTAVTAGIAAGAAAADAMLAERASDGRYGSFHFSVGSGIGEWRTTPPGFVNDPNAWVARVDPFAMKSTSQFRTPGPKTIGSGAYRKEYDEVKNLGGNGTTTPTNRTPEQTAVAQFFVANPVEMFNRTFRGLATSEALTMAEQARLFALLNLSGADAAIACWDDKAYWSFWRPLTAIRSDDGDPATDADPAWTSLIANPPYPDHPSGYNCQSGAFMHAAKAFFDRKIAFGLTANLASGPVTRTYERFTDVIDDTIDARIWLGIHFRSADVDGAWIGKRAANWLAENYLNPV